MRKELFFRIVNALENNDSYFENSVDGIGRDKISSIQKCTAAIRMLAYGMTGDAVDDYVRMAETTAIQCLKKFNECVINVFGEQCRFISVYRPLKTQDYNEKLYKINGHKLKLHKMTNRFRNNL